MERVTADAQRVEIERYTTHLVRAGVDESRAAHIAYPIMMMLHGVVMHRLLNKKQSPLGRAIAAACLEACVTPLESAAGGIAYCDLEPDDAFRLARFAKSQLPSTSALGA
jgi:hypothetical protein